MIAVPPPPPPSSPPGRVVRTTRFGLASALWLFACSSSEGGAAPPGEGSEGEPARMAPEASESGPASDPEPARGSGAGDVAPAAGSAGSEEPRPAADLSLAPDGAGDSTPQAPAAGGEAPADPAERALPDLPAVRQEHSVVALNGEVYAIGGFTPTVTASVQAFDPGAESWRNVANFPAPLHHANAAALGGRLYVAGFYAGGSFGNADGRVFEYDPDEDDWALVGQMPEGTQRASSCVASLGARIYLFGGARVDSVDDASAYDPESNTWQELPPLPESREHCLAAAIQGTLYIAAGRTDSIGGFVADTWAFDPETQTYSPRAPIPTPRGGAAGSVLNGKLYVFGGEGNGADPSGVFPQVEAYDAAADSWQSLENMLVPRHGLGGATVGSSIYLPGGATAQGFGAAADSSVLTFESL